MEIHTLTPERWPDVEELFGPRGACAGCWCMWWRLVAKDWERNKGQGNKDAFEVLVKAGEVPGLLAYTDGKPVGWCAIAPRMEYVRLERMRIFQPVDEQPVWSVTCFFVARGFRNKGVTAQLLQAAVDYAKTQGAQIVEGYPVEPKKGRMADVFVYTGLASTFRQVGFAEAARRSETRPIMRYVLKQE
jgi:GNAT superfamily N-acetyltransferase